MKFFGLTIGRQKSADDTAHLSDAEGGWWPVLREGFAGAWQANITIRRDTLLAFTAVYACVTRISRDIGKMPLQLKKKLPNGIWVDIDRNSPYLPVLVKPNTYQSRAQFVQQWLISKLLVGNTYILKVRDNRGIVVRMFVLDPTRVRPLITPDGSIYYAVSRDPLSDILEASVTFPADEIIHDRMPGLFHPLIGTSPIFACALAASQGHHMQRSSAAFFKNMAQPSGVLTAPGAISNETAARLKSEWTSKFTGRNVGAVAVLGDGLKWEALTMTSADAQLIEQLKWSGETVCSAFSVPPFMIGIAPPPTYTNIEAMTQQYWSTCLQSHMEDIELCLDEGLELTQAGTPEEIGVEMDLNVLLRMDTATRFKTWSDGIKGGFMTPNEARFREDLPPVKGGDTPYMQQQNFSLAALANRDAAGPAPSTPTPPAGAAPPATPALPAPGKSVADDEEQQRIFTEALNKALAA